MFKNLLFSLIIILCCVTIFAEDLNNSQKSKLKNIKSYLDKADKTSRVSVIKNYLRYAKSSLRILTRELPGNLEIKGLNERYKNIEKKAELAEVAIKLNLTLRSLVSRFKKYASPKKLSRWDKQYFEKSLPTLEKQVSFLKEKGGATVDIKNGEIAIQNINIILGKKSITKNNDKINSSNENSETDTSTKKQTPKEVNKKLTFSERNNISRANHYIKQAQRSSRETNKKRALSNAKKYIDKLLSMALHPKVKPTIDTYNGLLKSATTKSNNKQLSNEANTISVTAQEKRATSRLRSIFSFANRDIKSGKKVRNSLEKGEVISSGRFKGIAAKLRKNIEEATPHIKILGKKAQFYKSQIEKYNELTELTAYLEKSLEGVNKREKSKGILKSLQWAIGDMKEVDVFFNNYTTTIMNSDDPEQTFRSLLSKINRKFKSIADSINKAQKHYGAHPEIEKTKNDYSLLQEKLKVTIPQANLTVAYRKSILFAEKGKGYVDAGIKSSKYGSLDAFETAIQNYKKAIRVVKIYKKVPQVKDLLSLHTKKIQTTRKMAIEKTMEYIVSAIVKIRLFKVVNLFSFARKLGDDDKNLLIYIEKNELKITKIICANVLLKSKEMTENFSYWKKHNWENLITIAKLSEKNHNLIVDYTKSIAEKKLEKLTNTLQNEKMDPEDKLKLVTNLSSVLNSFAELDTKLAFDLKVKNKKIEEFKIANELAIEKKRQEEKRQEQLAKEKFENSLSAEQSIIYKEWDNEYPNEREEKPKYIRWLYIKSIDDYTDEYHTYFFSNDGKLTNKTKKKEGGGSVNDWIYSKFHKSTTYTAVASVYKDGRVYGYHKGSWTQILDFKKDGRVLGYQNDSWQKIGQFEKNDEIYGHKGSSWELLGKINGDTVNNYSGVIAKFTKDSVRGYNSKGDWETLSMNIATRKYAIGVILFILNRPNPDMYK